MGNHHFELVTNKNCLQHSSSTSMFNSQNQKQINFEWKPDAIIFMIRGGLVVKISFQEKFQFYLFFVMNVIQNWWNWDTVLVFHVLDPNTSYLIQYQMLVCTFHFHNRFHHHICNRKHWKNTQHIKSTP